jgi:hypothetical protein
MRPSARGAALVLTALAIVFLAGFGVASARTYNHGLTVWFNDQTVGAGDEVRGDVEIIYGSLTCNAGAVIDGNVRTFFGDFTQLDGCRVGGRVINAFNGNDVSSLVPLGSHGPAVDAIVQNRRVIESLAWDVVVVFIFLLFPLRVRVALDRVERHPGLSGLTGAIAVIAVLPIFILLLLSIIGIPLIVLEFAALLAGLWIGQAAVAMLVGRRLYELIRPHVTPSPLGALILGLIVVSAAQALPLVGWAVTALVWVIGLGAAILGFVHENSFPSSGGSGGVPMTTRPA